MLAFAGRAWGETIEEEGSERHVQSKRSAPLFCRILARIDENDLGDGQLTL